MWSKLINKQIFNKAHLPATVQEFLRQFHYLPSLQDDP